MLRVPTCSSTMPPATTRRTCASLSGGRQQAVVGRRLWYTRSCCPETRNAFCTATPASSHEYFARAIKRAITDQVGLAFMHSHPGTGWQGMSQFDVEAERDVLGYPAVATGLPLLGLTIGSDGYWSARFWEKSEGEMGRTPCAKVRVVGRDSYRLYF